MNRLNKAWKNQNKISANLISLLKILYSPFSSIFSLIGNKIKTGHFLLTDQMYSLARVDTKFTVFINTDDIGAEQLKECVHGHMALQETFLDFINIDCRVKIFYHATVLAIGRSLKGKPFAIFFNSMGTSPDNVILCDKEPLDEIRTLENYYLMLRTKGFFIR